MYDPLKNIALTGHLLVASLLALNFVTGNKPGVVLALAAWGASYVGESFSVLGRYNLAVAGLLASIFSVVASGLLFYQGV